jgi:hypothetical protein
MSKRILMVTALLACAFALRAEDKYYQINLAPSGKIISKDLPVTKGTMVVFHGYPSGELMSMPRSAVTTVVAIAAPNAQATNPATRVIPIGNLAMQGGSAQGGPQNARTVGAAKTAAAAPGTYGGAGFYSNLVPGQSEAMPNSPNDYQVGRTYAYAPSNATQSSPGAPPTNAATTNGANPPQ